MADIESSTISETASNNTAAPPDGAPANHARTAVKNIFRETLAAVKRFRNRITPTVTSAGTEPAFTLSYTTSPGAYVQGHVFAFKAHATPSGSVTLNVNTIGAKKVYDFYGNAQLGSAAWPANARVIVSYDTALDGGSGGFIWLNQGYSTAFSLTGQTAETTIATDDELLIADTSESGANNKMTVANFLKAVNALTEDTSPDSAADFLMTYDASGSAAKKAILANVGMPRGYLAGLTLSNNGSDATNDIDIAAGAARDSTNVTALVLAAALTKQLDAAWAVGTNQGGLDTGSIANATYHVWLIKRSDTGVVDALFSTSASSPTMPANYDYKRRIGSIIRSGGAILAFDQFGDRFMLDTPVLDISATSIGTSAVTRTLASVPTGVVVTALLNVWVGNATQADMVYLSALASVDLAPSSSAAPLNNAYSNAANVGNSGRAEIQTNTSAQIRSRSNSANSQLLLATKGWIDRRGRDD